MQKAYVILATYGEYDDFNTIPLFVCLNTMERDLFYDALQKHEKPYFDKVIDYFHKMYPNTDIENCVPCDIGFDCREVDVLTFFSTHPNT